MGLIDALNGGATLGIDASTKTIAHAIISEGKVVSYGESNLGDGDIYHRLGNAKGIMDGFISVVANDVNRCCIESAVRVNNVRTTVQLAYMYGIIMGTVVDHGIPLTEVSPVVWQKYIGNPPYNKLQKQHFAQKNPGRSASWLSNHIRLERKEKTIAWVQDTYGISVESDNIADAIGVAHWTAHHG